MFRFRRYRVFVILSLALLFLVYRAAQNSQWEAGTSAIYDSYSHAGTRGSEPVYESPGDGKEERRRPAVRTAETETEGLGADPGIKGASDERTKSEAVVVPPEPKVLATASEVAKGSVNHNPDAGHNVASADAVGALSPLASPTLAPEPAGLVDNIPGHQPSKLQGSPGQQDFAGGAQRVVDPPPASTTVHWRKLPEHFPVADSEIIPLPTGTPQKIPSVQAQFGLEPKGEQERREDRLAQVKREMGRAWGGYRKFAWTHDELKPVTKVFADPFGGWAATLVDAMDTLWIMGMHDEFDEAYAALDSIDFTTTPTEELQVFETIIRYLGGLIAAFDVSGGKQGQYPKLLSKAEELADILMGVFDTPNRMPILRYNWRPEFVSQPHLAQKDSSVAELGSLSMEFTRLAQLTGQNRYYDAVARITNAFDEWQTRGTALDGLFPQNVDATGCNRTATDLAAASRAAQQQAAQAELSRDPGGYSPAGDSSSSSSPSLSTRAKTPVTGFTIHPGDEPGAAGKAEFGAPELRKRALVDLESTSSERSSNDASTTPSSASSAANHADDETVVPGIPQKQTPNLHPDRANPFMREYSPPFDANGASAIWDCVKQNLTSSYPGMESYSMGGSQDSAYEYFPKQYVLLGGLEPQYRRLHEKTVAGVKKYLLFRPMLKDDRNVLFSAKALTRDGTDQGLKMDYEVTHLTCFLGGMFGLGGKIFNSPEDVEIAKRLADGCVWSYESMATGLMPEYSQVVPCASTESCPWNETVWFDHLDPNSDWRDSQMEDYQLRRKEWDDKRDFLLKQEEMRVLAEEEAAREARLRRPGEGGDGDAVADRPSADSASRISSSKQEGASDAQGHPDPRDLSYDPAGDARVHGHTPASAAQKQLSDGAGSSTQAPPKDPLMDLPPAPNKPYTHREYVERRIKSERIPPGYTSIIDRRYILRPEAIESVWYMYRITGDKVWQDKGWKMFQSVIKATQTAVGHSAVDDVTADKGPGLLDNMESFWMAETLKYFYLLFATPDVISLDEWVLNTEAHPFKRPR